MILVIYVIFYYFKLRTKLKLLSQYELKFSLSSSILIVSVETISPVDTQHPEHWQECAYTDACCSFQVKRTVCIEIVPCIARFEKQHPKDR